MLEFTKFLFVKSLNSLLYALQVAETKIRVEECFVAMERHMTRLTRNANSIWLLEFFGAANLEDLQQIRVGEVNSILNILKKNEAQKLIVDLASVQHFSSRDLQALVILHKQLAQYNIPLVLRNPGSHLRRIFRIMQFDSMFELEPDQNHHEMK